MSEICTCSTIHPSTSPSTSSGCAQGERDPACIRTDSVHEPNSLIPSSFRDQYWLILTGCFFRCWPFFCFRGYIRWGNTDCVGGQWHKEFVQKITLCKLGDESWPDVWVHIPLLIGKQ